MINPPLRRICTTLPIAFLALFALVFLTYSNTFDAAWHLDDFTNITENPSIKINTIDWESLAKPLASGLKDGRLDRPLARLSFALNWYFGKDSPEGYHIVNIVIHVVCAWLLYLTAAALFRSPNLKWVPAEDAAFICFLGTVLWTVNPLHTQAVTYIVQRMAAMAAMFYILSLYAYLRARLAVQETSRLGWAAVCVLGFLLGLSSKENAILLPVALFLVEVLFFQDLSQRRTRIWIYGIALVGGIILIGVGSLLFLKGEISSVFSYGNRFFTPWERLLTQTRVLLFYLSLVFYPVPTRLSIEHDVVISTSLLSPWTTLASVVIIVGLIALAIFWARKRPLLSFAILFYFLNHLVESSIIGLELVFEHRNYLPAMFLFFPIAAELKRLLDFYRARSQAMFAVLTVSTGLLVVGLGMGTYVRNQIWSSGQLLWEDAASKAPASSRPLHNLAWVHFERIGDYRSALELYRLALQGTKTNSFQESIILNNIASIYYAQKSYKQSVDYWSKALESYPGYAEAAYRLSLALMHSGDLAGAEYRIDSLLSDYARHPAALNLKGILLLQRGKAAESIRFFTPSLKARSTQSTALINIGSAFIALGEMQKAARFFRAAAFSSPSDKTAMLWMAALEAQKGNTAEADRWINSLLKSMKVADLSAWMTGDAVVRLQRDSILLPDRTPEFVDAMFSCIRRALHHSEMKSLVSAFPSVETEDERFLSLFGR